MSGPPSSDGYSTQATDPLSSVTIADTNQREWWLHWVYPEPALTHLDRSELSLGRDPTCDVVLPDTKVSRRHATVRLSPRSVPEIRDLGSSNGTAVDGQRCDTSWLNDGCVLRVGHSLAVVVYSEGNAEIARNLSADSRWPYVGSEKLSAALAKADRIAKLPGAVFIQAETGTGKEYLAQRVHAASGRSGKFVPINCAGIRGDLAIAQLFGHVKGAFTGASHAIPGALRQADNGTVFLDEVAELPLDSQALLLRATQTREVTPLGSSLTIPTDFRVTCASHVSLVEMVAQQTFRADLYYRLSQHQLSLPPLRQRREDIVALFEHMSGLKAKRLQCHVVEQLLLHSWPGNIRELENTVAALQAQTGNPESWISLPLTRLVARSESSTPERLGTTPKCASDPVPIAKRLSPQEWQRLYTMYHGNAAEVARVTGMKPTTVKRYFANLGLRGP